jgi:alpha-L-rhamnosidase
MPNEVPLCPALLATGSHVQRRRLLKVAGAGVSSLLVSPLAALGLESASTTLSMTSIGAIGDGQTLNTRTIQAAIDKLASKGGGTLTVPSGVFRTGAIFLKPGVHLHLEQGGVLKGSTDIRDYPTRRTRVEGHFEDWVPAMLNADGCNGLRITGPGTLDGSGAPFWQAFWDARAINKETKNLDVPRPRLALIENSRDVRISGPTFKDSAFWNLHMYRCQKVLIENTHFEVPDGVRCPSTDGTDIDSCQHVTIRGCTFRVDDDCICLKGSKGPFALDDKDSPAVEHIRIENNTYFRGGGVVTLGSEATTVRDVIVEHCTVNGKVNVLRLKLRPDTPQLYEDIHIRDITLNTTGGQIINCAPWKQYFDLRGQPPPQSAIHNVTFNTIRGHGGAFGQIAGNPGQSTIRDLSFENVNVQLLDPALKIGSVTNIKVKNVIVDGRRWALEQQ